MIGPPETVRWKEGGSLGSLWPPSSAPPFLVLLLHHNNPQCAISIVWFLKPFLSLTTIKKSCFYIPTHSVPALSGSISQYR